MIEFSYFSNFPVFRVHACIVYTVYTSQCRQANKQDDTKQRPSESTPHKRPAANRKANAFCLSCCGLSDPCPKPNVMRSPWLVGVCVCVCGCVLAFGGVRCEERARNSAKNLFKETKCRRKWRFFADQRKRQIQGFKPKTPQLKQKTASQTLNHWHLFQSWT